MRDAHDSSPRLSVQLLERGRAVLTGLLHDRPDAPPDDALVSCLLVTRGRAAMAERAARCFAAQSHRRAELVVIDDDPDASLTPRLLAIGDERIRHWRMPESGAPLGALRNLAVEAARGEFVTQWDDDDLYPPRRLELQLRALRTTAADACSLLRHSMWWPRERRFALSTHRIWEGSLLARRAVMPRYPELRRGEDSPLVDAIVKGARYVVLDAPNLYLYVAHGANTFEAGHFDEHYAAASERFEGASYDEAIERFARQFPSAVRERLAGLAPAATGVVSEGEPAGDVR